MNFFGLTRSRSSMSVDTYLFRLLCLCFLWVLCAGCADATPPTLQSALTEFALPPSVATPQDITSGPDGALWFTEQFRRQHGVLLPPGEIGRISTAGKISEFPLPLDGNGAGEFRGITAGPDGAIWFTYESTESIIGRLTPEGHLTQVKLPGVQNGFPATVGITTGPDRNLWVTINDNHIGRLTPAGQLTEFSFHPIATVDAAGGSYPDQIVAGPDGALWFTEVEQGDGFAALGRISTSGNVTQFLLPTKGYDPGDITAGPDGALWFTEGPLIGTQPDKIGRITTTGKISEFPLPPNSQASSLTVGHDGNLWFTEEGLDTIGRITPGGKLTEFPLHKQILDTGLVGITSGPDGNLWATEYHAEKIGRISLRRVASSSS